MNQPENPATHEDAPENAEAVAQEDKVVELARQALADDDTMLDTAEDPEHIQNELQAQIADLNDRLMRAVAETENVRKRAQRDLEESGKYAITGFARQMISVLENLTRATSSISEELRDENEQVKNLAEGVEMTLRELISGFDKFGITKVDPQAGEKFDHNIHQAMSQVEDPEAEPGSILHVMQSGYTIHDRLLQPAMVVVAKRGEPVKQVDTEA